MTTLRVTLDGGGAWEDLQSRVSDVIHVPHESLEIATLDQGMTSGNPSMAIRVDLPDGRVVFVETSVKLFLAAAALIRAKYPEVEF